jgi:hypothetical protein
VVEVLEIQLEEYQENNEVLKEVDIRQNIEAISTN